MTERRPSIIREAVHVRERYWVFSRNLTHSHIAPYSRIPFLLLPLSILNRLKEEKGNSSETLLIKQPCVQSEWAVHCTNRRENESWGDCHSGGRRKMSPPTSKHRQLLNSLLDWPSSLVSGSVFRVCRLWLKDGIQFVGRCPWSSRGLRKDVAILHGQSTFQLGIEGENNWLD